MTGCRRTGFRTFPQKRALAGVPGLVLDDRDAALLHPVSEPRQDRGQHGQRADQRHRNDEDGAGGERLERRRSRQVHPGHGDHHGEARDQHRTARRRRGGRQRRLLAPSGLALLALAPQVEHRVVDADSEADEQDDLVDGVVDSADDVAQRAHDADRRDDGRQREQQRYSGGDERAECEQQDDQGDREGGGEGLAEVVLDDLVDLLLGAGVAELAQGEAGVRLLDVGDGLNRRLDAVHDVAVIARQLEAEQRRVPIVRDLVRVRGGQRTLEVLCVGERRELALHLDRDGAEGRVGGGGPGALDQHHLLGVLRSRIGNRLIRTSGLADAGLGVLERLGPGGAADHEGNDDEGEPAPDGGLAVLCAPDTSAGRDSTRTARRILVRGTRRHADLHVIDGQSRPYPFEPVVHIEPVSNVRVYVIAYA